MKIRSTADHRFVTRRKPPDRKLKRGSSMRQIDSVLSHLKAERTQLLDSLPRIDRQTPSTHKQKAVAKELVGCGQSKDCRGSTGTLGEMESLSARRITRPGVRAVPT